MSRGMKVGLIVGVLALAGGGGVAYSIEQEEERRHRGPHGAGRPTRPGQRGDRQRQDRGARPRWTSAPTSPAASSEIAVREGDLVTQGPVPASRSTRRSTRPRCHRARGRGRLDPGHAAPGPGQPRPGRAGLEPRAASSASSGPNLIAPEAVEQAQTASTSPRRPIRRPARSWSSPGPACRRPGTTWPRPGWSRRSRAGSCGWRWRRAKWRCPAPSRGRPACCMTIADLSVILAKVQVDETDVVRLSDRRLGARSPSTPTPTPPSSAG